MNTDGPNSHAAMPTGYPIGCGLTLICAVYGDRLGTGTVRGLLVAEIQVLVSYRIHIHPSIPHSILQGGYHRDMIERVCEANAGVVGYTADDARESLRGRRAAEEAERNRTETCAKRYAQYGLADMSLQKHVNYNIF